MVLVIVLITFQANKASLGMKDKKVIYGWNSNELDSHMMTNVEWGGCSLSSQVTIWSGW